MNRDEITRKTSELSTIAHTTEDSKVEYWYARELMTYMGVRQMGKLQQSYYTSQASLRQFRRIR
ncbi:hypothetical protein LF912_10435 [Bifidobacterium longum]|uniref:hypothetical protein n=1 Tax=Bifidobacterium longum TaxID=216816 RepID=UPI001F0FB2E6|nr:hypothetical protein [Bifidobacterium longum]MCH4847085.1 hypothetical protein [Bifidobacterium longum]